jgi:integrase
MENMTKRRPTKFPGVYSRGGIHRKGKLKGKVDTVFDVSFKDGGRKVWKKIGWKLEGITPKVASQYRAEWVRKIRLGEELPWEKKKIPLFSEMAESYLEWAKENKTRAGRDERCRYDAHLKEPLSKKRLSEISPFHLERLKSDLAKKELSPATVKHCLVLVREIFNKAIAWKKFQGQHPLRGVKMPSLNNRRERFLSYEEADLLLKELWNVSKSVHDQALLSLHCGLRAGEIFNLRGQDIDFQNGIIRIMDPKNKTNRTAYMTQATRERLKERIPKEANELIFKDRWHKGQIAAVSKTFENAVEELGFNNGVEDPRQRVVFHTLRHTFASWLAIQGTPILTIKELMGHKSLSMTGAICTPEPGHEAGRYA